MPENRLQQRSGRRAAIGHALLLTRSGVAVALLVGVVALLAGWRWAALLVVFFVAATAASRFRRDDKIGRAGDLLEKAGARDGWQVAANGGAFALGAVAWTLTGSTGWAGFSLGALAAASADTWATEIGLLSERPPRSIVSGRMVPPGFSGGVTLAGMAGGGLGALVVAATARSLQLDVAFIAIISGGLAGMIADSLMGATIQAHRWCAQCSRVTERRVHSCGSPTRRHSGVPGLNNDAVNGAAAAIGGAVSVFVWWLLG